MKINSPKIVLIVIDTMDAKHMSLCGYPRQITPHLEHLAQDCTVYTRCFAPACWTIPSHASMFTDLYPSQHGAYEGKLFLDEKVPHLVPILQKWQPLPRQANKIIETRDGSLEIYDLGKEPSEGYDLSPEIFPEVLENLRTALDLYKHEIGYYGAVGNVKYLYNSNKTMNELAFYIFSSIQCEAAYDIRNS